MTKQLQPDIMIDLLRVLSAAPNANDTLSVGSDKSHASTAHSKNRKALILRHGERVDLTLGTWVPYCFDEFNNYVRKDLNMPKSLLRRKNCPESWLTDSPLTNIGLYQAKLTGEALFDSGIRIDHVFCSPSYRCVQTCRSALEGLGLNDDSHKIKLEPGLFESVAWYPDGVPDWCSNVELIDANYNIDIHYQPFVSVSNLNECVKETSEEFYTRNYEVMRRIIESTQGNILVVGHATTLDTCTRQLVGKAPRTINELIEVITKTPYCSLATVELINGTWQLTEPECMPVTHSKNARFEWNVLTAT